jgi:hypothetical protein
MIYQLSRQEKSHYCIPSCIQAILKKYNFQVSQDEIAEKLGCLDKAPIFGENLNKFFHDYKMNFYYYNYNEVPFSCPSDILERAFKRNRDSMLGYKTENGLHIQLITDFKDPLIKLLDPDTVKEHLENLDNIYHKMHSDKLGGFGTISLI